MNCQELINIEANYHELIIIEAAHELIIIEAALGAAAQRILNPLKTVLAMLMPFLRVLVLVLHPLLVVHHRLRRRHVDVRP